jgi:hypothetical protein
MHLTAFDRFAWATASIQQILLLAVLFMRRRAVSFPIFTACVVKQLTVGFVIYFIFFHYSLAVYQHWFWSVSLMDEALALLVVWEITRHVFCPTGVWARDVRRTVIGLAGASAFLAFLLSWAAQPAAPRRIQTLVLRNNLFTTTLISELFVGMVVLSSIYGLPWKTHAARITQGLGTLAIIGMALDIISNFIGLSREQHTYRELNRIYIAVGLVCNAYWIVMLWAEAPEDKELPEAMRIQIYTLQRQVENDLRRIRSWRNN